MNVKTMGTQPLGDLRVEMPSHFDLFYGGEWRPAVSGATFDTINPATGVVLATVAEAGAEDVGRAVEAAQRALPGWRALPPSQRGALVRQVAERVRVHVQALALLDALDSGNPLRAMLGDVQAGAASLEFFAGLATEIKGETIPMGDGVLNYVAREPLGVVGRILPFNHPIMFVCAKIGAPLVAGNTVILKVADQTPLSALRFAELVADLLPPGVLNILTGKAAAGAALSSHPGVAGISLIGSVPTGRAVLRGAAETIKPTVLELGGKNALIAFPDADPEKVAAGAVSGMNLIWTAGQSCGSTSRLFLHDSLHDRVLASVVERVEKIRMGDPALPDTEMGCLVSQAQFDKVKGFIQDTEKEGARLMAGGGPPEGEQFAQGFFMRPTVFAGVTRTMRVAREEVFGPLLSVFRWSDEREMLETVNGVEYGLTASIWTNNLATAHRVAAVVEAGYVWINNSGAHFLGAPFGGYKQSGIGREECLDELLSYTRIKNVHVTLNP